MDIRVEENPAAAVADMLVEAAERGSHIVLTGGSTPKLAYETAAAKNANWNGSTIWFTDERCVSPDSSARVSAGFSLPCGTSCGRFTAAGAGPCSSGRC